MLRLRTLGALDLRTGDGTPLLSLLRRPKHIALLIYLVVDRPGEFQRRDTLCALFWPEADERHARGALSQTLTRIRQAVGRDVIEGRGSDEIRVRPGTIDCDAVALETAAAAGDHEHAVALYRAAFLPGFHLTGADGFERWLEDERRRLRELAAASARSAARDRLRLRDLVEAERLAAQALELAPANEPVVRELMEWLCAAGDRVGAIRLFDTWAAALSRDLELEPSQELQTFAREVQTSASRAAPAEVLAASGAGESAADIPPSVTVSSERMGRQTGAPTGRRDRRARRWWKAAAAVGFCAIVVGLSVRFAGIGRGSLSSLAVLPVVDLSNDPENAYLAEGIHDAIVSDLAGIESLRVTSRTSMLRYRGTTEPIPEIARDLGVDAVLETTLLRDGERVSVTAQLIDGRSDDHIWSERYELEMTDLLRLRVEIAARVARELRVTLSPAEMNRLTAVPSVDPAAYQAYLRGRYHLEQLNPEHTARALSSLEQAVAVDSAFAPAWAALAVAHCMRSQWIGGNENPSVTVPAAEHAARAALALDSNVAGAHFALGYTEAYYHWRWEKAEQEFRRGLELEPNHLWGRVFFANFLTWMGRLGEAEAIARETVRIAPLSPWAANELQHTLFWQGRVPEAVAVALGAYDLDPDFPQTLMLYAEGTVTNLGQPERGIAMAERLLTLLPDDPDAMWYAARAFMAAGDTARARDLRLRLERQAAGNYTPPGILLEMSLRLGDRRGALQHLQQAFEARDPRLIMLKMKAGKPAFAPIRDDPVFRQIIRAMAFPN